MRIHRSQNREVPERSRWTFSYQNLLTFEFGIYQTHYSRKEWLRQPIIRDTFRRYFGNPIRFLITRYKRHSKWGMGEQRYVITLSIIAVIWMGLFLFCITTVGKYYIQHILLSDAINSSTSGSMVSEQVSSGIWYGNMNLNRFQDYSSQYSIPTSSQPHYSFFYDPDTTEDEERAFDFRSVTWMEEYQSVKQLIQQSKPLYSYGGVLIIRDQDGFVKNLGEK